MTIVFFSEQNYINIFCAHMNRILYVTHSVKLTHANHLHRAKKKHICHLEKKENFFNEVDEIQRAKLLLIFTGKLRGNCIQMKEMSFDRLLFARKVNQ